MARHEIDPIEALRRVAGRWRARRPAATPVEEALGRFLATPVEVPPAPEGAGRARAAIDGYALRPGCAEIRAEDRVEAGGLLPPGIDRIVPIGSTSIAASGGGEPVRIRTVEGARIPAGHGVLGGREAPLAFPAGTRVDGRLQALLLARGTASIETFPPASA